MTCLQMENRTDHIQTAPSEAGLSGSTLLRYIPVRVILNHSIFSEKYLKMFANIYIEQGKGLKALNEAGIQCGWTNTEINSWNQKLLHLYKTRDALQRKSTLSNNSKASTQTSLFKCAVWSESLCDLHKTNMFLISILDVTAKMLIRLHKHTS